MRDLSRFYQLSSDVESGLREVATAHYSAESQGIPADVIKALHACKAAKLRALNSYFDEIQALEGELTPEDEPVRDNIKGFRAAAMNLLDQMSLVDVEKCRAALEELSTRRSPRLLQRIA